MRKSFGEFVKDSVKDRASIALGTVGAIQAAAIGAAIGSVIPVVGTFVGGVIGAMVGGILGETVGKHYLLQNLLW